jgi:aspartate/methionine/tyrosine aminotransferase
MINLSDRAKSMFAPELPAAAKFAALRSSMHRATRPDDATGYLEFGNSDAGRDPYNPEKHIRDAAKKAIDYAGEDLVYTPSNGLLEVRQAIAKSYYEKKYGFKVDPNTEIQVTVGTQMGIFMTCQCLLNPGDKVLIADPDYNAYNRIIKYAGGVPVRSPFKEGKDAQTRFDAEAFEKAATKDIKIMMFTNPNNPGGYVMAKSDLEVIAKAAIKNDFLVFADELYDRLVYDGKKYVSFTSIPNMKDRLITSNGVSKTESMQAFRIGWIVAPEKLMQAISRLASSILIRSPYISQKALLAFLEEPEKFRPPRTKTHQEARDLVHKELSKIDGIVCNKPMGSSYIFFNHRAINPSSYEFAYHLLEKGNVLLNPGGPYGPQNGEGHLRFCFASHTRRLEEGLRRIKVACEQL